MSQPVELPRWIDVAVLPAVNLAFALIVAGIVVAIVGFDPLHVLKLLLKGAFGTKSGISYTLYYATTFAFTGLAVAVAFHGGLFNIGGEGQAIMGGLGAALMALALSPHLPAWLMLPLMVIAAAAFGMAWAAVPGALQAWRGSHIVITTIMFNFIAAAPLNASLLLAIAASVAVWLALWKSQPGYALRAVGFAPDASLYAGIRPRRLVLLSMAVSGALAGMVGINEIAGVHGRLIADFVAGAGFAGIAVSLIGRNHPLGIALAAVLFGALYQGGAELAFEIPGFSRDMVFMMQGLIVLFAGAMAYVAAPTLARIWRAVSGARGPEKAAAHG
jgi:simple sugar transport system permease protein